MSNTSIFLIIKRLSYEEKMLRFLEKMKPQFFGGLAPTRVQRTAELYHPMTIFLIHLSCKSKAPILISAPTPIEGEKTYLSLVVSERPRASAPVKKRVRGGKNWNLTEATSDSNIFISLILCVWIEMTTRQEA